VLNTLFPYGVLFVFVQLAIACSPASQRHDGTQTGEQKQHMQPETGTAETTDRDLVVAFGDSLFAGYKLRQNEGFVQVLERKLTEMGQPAQVFNASVSGDTSTAGLQRLAFVLDGLPKKPDLVIVELGGNDMLRGINPDRTKKNLTAIMDELDRRDINAMLAGMVASPNMGTEYAEAFNSIYPELAAQYAVPLYPFILDGVVGNEKLLLPDGVHPNPEGVEIITSGIGPMVMGILED